MCSNTLLPSDRLFSEGGDFAPQELRLVQRRLTEEAKQLAVKEEAFYSEMEEFESSSLQQVKTPSHKETGRDLSSFPSSSFLLLLLLHQVREVCTRLEENIGLMKAELEFKEQTQQVYGSTQIHLKAEVPECLCPPVRPSIRLSVLLSEALLHLQVVGSSQQQSAINSRLEDLKMMMDDAQVAPGLQNRHPCLPPCDVT